MLSVIATQFQTIQDAAKEGRKTFVLEGEELTLNPTYGLCMSMNPGYLGRTNLPRTYLSLFRPIRIIAPNLGLIIENMMMGEGFQRASEHAPRLYNFFKLAKV